MLSRLKIASILALLSVSNALAQIPPEQYDSSSKAAIGIIQSINQESSTLRVPQISSEEKYQRALIAMNMPFEFSLELLKNGARNLHSTGNTNGDFDPEMRLTIESFIAGKRFSKKFSTTRGVHILPKYAYVVFPNEKPMRMGEYGDIFIIFKDDVKKRITWTPADSFNLESESSRAEALRDGKLNTFDFAANPIERMGAYFEAQVWGPLDARDVAEIAIPKVFRPDDHIYPHAKAMIEELVRMGIPISTYDQDHQRVNLAFNERTIFPPHVFPKDLKILTPRERKALYLKTFGMEEPTPYHVDLAEAANKRVLEKFILPNLPEKKPKTCLGVFSLFRKIRR